MAHRIKITFVPSQNKDGKPSKTNGTWVATDRTRGKKVTIYEQPGKNTKTDRGYAEEAVDNYLAEVRLRHVQNNPNDLAHRRKNGY